MKLLIKNRSVLTLLLSLFFVSAYAQKPAHHYVVMDTEYGQSLLKLYNETPKHKENFIKLAREGYYDSLLFHRVIHNFMIQGGDPQSRYAAEKQVLGNGGPDYRIPAEFQEGLFHKKGALAAARDNNPEKASSGSQFYIVQGHVFTEAGLDSLEIFRREGKKFSDAQRETYTTIGGTPHLDDNYTVFGEIIEGLAVVDSIAGQKTDERDRPLSDIHMTMKLLTRREALNFEREQQGLKPKNDVFTRFFDLFRSKNY